MFVTGRAISAPATVRAGTTMFMTSPRSRHQRRRARDATDFYECMMIHSRIESPSVPVQCMHMKVLVRYIVTGCIFGAPSGLRQGQVFVPPAAVAPSVQMKVECPPPLPGGVLNHEFKYVWCWCVVDNEKACLVVLSCSSVYRIHHP